MFGKASHLSPLESRKQLLIAESELNRAQWSEDWQTLAQGVHDLARRVETMGAWASAAALVVAGIMTWRRGPPAPGAATSSWFQRILKGARLASRIWIAFRARGHQPERQSPPTRSKSGKVGGGLRSPRFVSAMLGLLLWAGCFMPAPQLAGAPQFPPTEKGEANPTLEPTGPTLHLDYGRGESPGNPVAEFMYFVALISLEPVAIVKSPGNTQRARMVSATRSFSARSFLVICEFDFAGEGNQQNVLDHTEKVRQHEQALKQGGTLDHQLWSINVEGTGSVSVKVAGTMTGQVPTVTEVRLRFNGHGKPSPVTIGLHDIRYFEGSFRPHNECVARVNTLVFRRKPDPNKMAITVASVKPKDGGNNFLQKFVGSLKGTTVNLLMPPITVEPAGSEAMLDFGLALALEAPTFTFPRAKNLKPGA